jgi:hypothetical protein
MYSVVVEKRGWGARIKSVSYSLRDFMKATLKFRPTPFSTE